MFRLALFSAAAMIALPPASVKAAEVQVQYVGGTRNAIPPNTVGWLKFDNPKELMFNYGPAIFRMPYSQITGSDLQNVDDSKKLFGHVPLPSLTPWKKRKQNLSITFNAGDKPGTLNFLILVQDAVMAEALLTAARNPKPDATQTADDSFWGDRIWKTNRNRPTWASEKPADTSQAPQSAAATTPAK